MLSRTIVDMVLMSALLRSTPKLRVLQIMSSAVKHLGGEADNETSQDPYLEEMARRTNWNAIIPLVAGTLEESTPELDGNFSRYTYHNMFGLAGSLTCLGRMKQLRTQVVPEQAIFVDSQVINSVEDDALCDEDEEAESLGAGVGSLSSAQPLHFHPGLPPQLENLTLMDERYNWFVTRLCRAECECVREEYLGPLRRICKLVASSDVNQLRRTLRRLVYQPAVRPSAFPFANGNLRIKFGRAAMSLNIIYREVAKELPGEYGP